MSVDIITAYRHLYRHGLRAIQFSKPARFTLRNCLRTAFRKGDAKEYDQEKVDNTVEFLKGATRETGIEHKILKNLLYVWYHQTAPRPSNRLRSDPDEVQIKVSSYDSFSHAIQMLNESMRMCLPCSRFIKPDPYSHEGTMILF